MKDSAPLPYGVDLVVDGGPLEAIQAAVEEMARRRECDADTRPTTEPAEPKGEAEEPMPNAKGSAALAIFRSLFAGRTDAYGKPDPANPKSGLCVREPLTDQVIALHLRGVLRVGVYPLRDDLTVSFAAADFDGGEDDLARAVAFCRAGEGAGMHPYLERSKGKGFHVWLFFNRPVPAAVVRRALRRLADGLGLPSSLEIFPKQDTLAGKKFGNYIYLPLNGREQVNQGRTAFLDWRNGCQPFDDPIAPLREVQYSELEVLEQPSEPGRDNGDEGQHQEAGSEGEEESESEGASESDSSTAPLPGEVQRLRHLYEAIRTKGVDAGRGGHRHGAALFLGHYLRADGWPKETALSMADAINQLVFRPPLEYRELKHQVEDGYRGWRINKDILAGLKEALLADERPDPFDPEGLEIYEIGNPAHLNLPLPPQIVEQHVVADGNNAIGGFGKLGKSLYAAHLVYHIAAGIDLFGRFKVEQRPVLYVTNEDHPALLASRFRRVLEGNARTSVPLRWIAPPGLDLCEPRWVEYITRQAKDGVLVIDVLAKSLGRRNENETKDMNEVAISLHMIREAGVTPFLVHHITKTRGEDARGPQKPSTESWRGSTVIFNCLDIGIQMLDHGRDKAGRKLRRLYSWTKVAPDGLDIIVAINPNPKGPLFEYVGEFEPDRGKGDRVDRLYELMLAGVPISSAEGAALLNHDVKPDTVSKYFAMLEGRGVVTKTGKTKDAKWTKHADSECEHPE